jgi:hypothetical protein
MLAKGGTCRGLSRYGRSGFVDNHPSLFSRTQLREQLGIARGQRLCGYAYTTIKIR